MEILIQCNLKVADFLDITLDLNTGKYSPYHKPDKKQHYLPTCQTTCRKSTLGYARVSSRSASRVTSQLSTWNGIKTALLYLQRLKQMNRVPSIMWRIIRKAKAYTPRKCLKLQTTWMITFLTNDLKSLRNVDTGEHTT